MSKKQIKAGKTPGKAGLYRGFIPAMPFLRPAWDGKSVSLYQKITEGFAEISKTFGAQSRERHSDKGSKGRFIEMIETAIRYILVNDTTVKAITTRCYPVNIPQTPTYPLILYTQISGHRDHTLRGGLWSCTPKISD